eukprot:CAMPEP_0183712174 /NCGR_PEP_ID=MMETSP0737-20130205/7382_1 /TAXON_ID=385413 /ORGANISM="Thalassiosira miniscula, Strain CCMP1093" /LENGTH=221 /DNA_ID=CAMNT_0025940753 /DNA_START=722 /DNA_END=1390 /DNA_ORIENTATION=-
MNISTQPHCEKNTKRQNKGRSQEDSSKLILELQGEQSDRIEGEDNLRKRKVELHRALQWLQKEKVASKQRLPSLEQSLSQEEQLIQVHSAIVTRLEEHVSNSECNHANLTYELDKERQTITDLEGDVTNIISEMEWRIHNLQQCIAKEKANAVKNAKEQSFVVAQLIRRIEKAESQRDEARRTLQTEEPPFVHLKAQLASVEEELAANQRVAEEEGCIARL